MNTLIEILESFWGFLDTGWQFILNCISTFVTAFAAVGMVGQFVRAFFYFFPGILGASILITLAIYVIKFIFGR